MTNAEAMAEGAANHADVFIGAGLPADFIARLADATKAVKNSIDGRALNRGRGVSGTAGLKQMEKEARDAVKILDSLVVPTLGTDDHLVAEWRSIKRVTAKPGVAVGSSRLVAIGEGAEVSASAA
jgi:hypothetical protein